MTLVTVNEKQTRKLGERIGRALKPGDTVYLYGDLGAGKTVIAKGIARAFGIDEKKITSASFTIVSEHAGRAGGMPVPFYHIDLYRLEGQAEADEIGIEEYMGGPGVSVIEWAERLEAPSDGIKVHIKALSPEKREITTEGLEGL